MGTAASQMSQLIESLQLFEQPGDETDIGKLPVPALSPAPAKLQNYLADVAKQMPALRSASSSRPHAVRDAAQLVANHDLIKRWP